MAREVWLGDDGVGRKLTNTGYVLVNVLGGWIPEHRYVVSKNIGRTLKPTEHVHHKNQIRDDNRLENLELLTDSEHMSITRAAMDRNPEVKERMRKSLSVAQKKYWKKLRADPEKYKELIDKRKEVFGTDEYREKQRRAALKRNRNSDGTLTEAGKAQADRMRKHTHTPEAQAKVSAARRGTKMSADAKKNMSVAQKKVQAAIPDECKKTRARAMVLARGKRKPINKRKAMKDYICGECNENKINKGEMYWQVCLSKRLCEHCRHNDEWYAVLSDAE